jgi:putative transcriptional regulator
MPQVRVQISELLEAKARREGRERITQEELSAAIGIPQGTISRWAGNKVDRLDRHIMAALCDYFECDLNELLVLDRSR